jgi:hypothetical protein
MRRAVSLRSIAAALVVLGLAPGIARAQSGTVALSFTGNSLGDPSLPTFAPPDSDGAAGLTNFVEFTNGEITIFSKSDGSIVSRSLDNAFWSSAGVTIPAGGLSDPRVLFDPSSQRWFVSEITTVATNNLVLLAISKDADPTHGFRGVSYTAPPNNQFGDFDTLGVNADGVTIATNNFNGSGTTYLGTSITSIPKADLLSTSPTVANRTTFNDSASSSGFTLHGVTNFGPSVGHTSVVAVASTTTSFINGVLDRTNINNVTGPGSATLGPTTPVTVQLTANSVQAHQPDGSQQIDSVDERIGSNAYQVGGNIFVAHSIEVGGHDAIRVTVLNESTNAVVAEATLSDATFHFDYIAPSIAVNANGDIVVGFTRSGDSTTGSAGFLSSYAGVGKLTGSTLTFGTPFLAGNGVGDGGGQANYHLFGGSFERWGDFSTTTTDPNNPLAFWTVQEWAGTSNVWHTQVTEILINSPVPEPGPLALAGVCGLGVMLLSRRRKAG